MLRSQITFLIAASVTLSGCGSSFFQSRLDASDDEHAIASMEAMMSPFSDEEKEQIAADMLTIAKPDVMLATRPETMTVENVSVAHLYRSLDGMTVAQIRARAKAIRQQESKGKEAKFVR
jgi:hypothetical protein